MHQKLNFEASTLIQFVTDIYRRPDITRLAQRLDVENIMDDLPEVKYSITQKKRKRILKTQQLT